MMMATLMEMMLMMRVIRMTVMCDDNDQDGGCDGEDEGAAAFS